MQGVLSNGYFSTLSIHMYIDFAVTGHRHRAFFKAVRDLMINRGTL